MNWMKRSIAVLGMTALLTVGSIGPASADDTEFNDEYVYVTTRGVSDLNIHPAGKLSLYPITLALDTALLPFAVIAGFVTT
jgi:hypothetical protein